MSTERPIGYGRQDITEDDIAAVVQCLRGDFLTQGPAVAAFEESLRAATGARHAVAVANGTAALHLAYLALGVDSGDVGVTSPISFVATSNAFLYCGAAVEFADVDPTTGILRTDALEDAVARVTQRGRTPKVLTPVDLAGQPFDREDVQRIAKRVGAHVVEDAAHSLGGSYRVDGRDYRVGSCAHADAAIFSFHPVKHVTTGEGGAIMTNDDVLYRRLMELRTHGIHRDAARFTRAVDDPFVGPWYYEQSELGFNYRITDLQCALGLSQMKRLDEFIARRRVIARRYDDALSAGPLAEHLAPAKLLPGREHAYHLYVVQLKARAGEALADIARRRRTLFNRLADRRVHCQIHYIPIPWQPYYRNNPSVTSGSLDGAERYYACSLSIPMFPAMTDSDVARVIDALEEACHDL